MVTRAFKKGIKMNKCAFMCLAIFSAPGVSSAPLSQKLSMIL